MGGTSEIFSNPAVGFWLTIYAISMTVLLIWGIGYLIMLYRCRKCLSWDLHSEYIDVAEFSNKNIPLRVTYKGIEPRWLWATYVSLRNTGRLDILGEDTPSKQHIIAGQEGCRYIGFNRLISDKAKVTLSPLFMGNDVYCKIEFDRLGPGDEILLSLLFIAEEQRKIELDGNLFGSGSRLISGFKQRMQSWRRLWWLLIFMIVAGTLGGIILLNQALYSGGVILLHFQTLLIMYMLALIAAALFLRPIRFWQQITERFQEGDGEPRRDKLLRTVKFILGLTNEP